MQIQIVISILLEMLKILNGGDLYRILSLDSTGVQNDNDYNVHFTVQGITFRDGYGDLYGGGVYMDGHKANMTIQNCNFLSNGADSGGAGANAYSGSGTVTLKGCIFIGNTVDDSDGEGGGAYVASPNGTIVVENNAFSGNTIYYGDGVGVYIWGGTVTVTLNSFTNNTTAGEYSYGGGGAYIDGDNITVTYNTFTDNAGGSSSEGGGAYISGSDSLTMTGNSFTNNTAEYDGGGAKVEGWGVITMTDNVFTGNTGGEGGGADIYVNGDGELLMANNVFADNTAINYGGGGVDLSLYSLTVPANITNHTFTQNSAAEGGGLYIRIWENTAILNFYNNIVYGNTATTGGDLYLMDDWYSGGGDGIGSFVNLFNNDFGSLYTQDGDNMTQSDNISADPLLTADYHLTAVSPCIEAGNNDAPGLPGIDMDGDARIINDDGLGDATVDIGADEYKYIDTDSDGVQDSEEMGPAGNDPNYDGNGDGNPDHQQNNVASLHTHDGEDYVTLASNVGALSNVQAIAPPGSPPDGVNFEYGCFDFTVTGLSVGGAAIVTIFGPEGAVFDAYYKYGPTPDNHTPHWYKFIYDGNTGAEINGNQITLYLVDGLRGDGDLIENGDIVEPGGPAIITAEVCEGDLEGDDGDVDGSDLAELVANPALLDLSTFAAEFGRKNCPQT